MVSNADRIGSAVTVNNDNRITKVGSKLRHLRLDELPQLFDVISGDMSFVGTRPEVTKYVDRYEPEYYATLLLPAGITSEASIRYKDEDPFTIVKTFGGAILDGTEFEMKAEEKTVHKLNFICSSKDETIE
jgi:lipopolysaccharide/colanic/teichoic acid biosynthesis glycosyltransferase